MDLLHFHGNFFLVGHDSSSLSRRRTVSIGRGVSHAGLPKAHDSGAGSSLRNSRHRPFSNGPGFRILLLLGQTEKEIHRQSLRFVEEQNRQRTSEVGVFRSRHRIPTQQPARTSVPGAAGKQTRQREGADRIGSQTGSRRLPYASTQRGFRYETISELLIWSGTGEPDA